MTDREDSAELTDSRIDHWPTVTVTAVSDYAVDCRVIRQDRLAGSIRPVTDSCTTEAAKSSHRTAEESIWHPANRTEIRSSSR